jgi:hypothetical protein
MTMKKILVLCALFLASPALATGENERSLKERVETLENEELDSLETRLATMRKELDQLTSSTSNEVKEGLKKNIGDALISAGALLKDLGKEVKE